MSFIKADGSPETEEVLDWRSPTCSEGPFVHGTTPTIPAGRPHHRKPAPRVAGFALSVAGTVKHKRMRVA